MIEKRYVNETREIGSGSVDEKKTPYMVTMSFLCHATVLVYADSPDLASAAAINLVDNGAITMDDFKQDDSWRDSLEIEEVYDYGKEQVAQSVFSIGNRPNQRGGKES